MPRSFLKIPADPLPVAKTMRRTVGYARQSPHVGRLPLADGRVERALALRGLQNIPQREAAPSQPQHGLAIFSDPLILRVRTPSIDGTQLLSSRMALHWKPRRKPSASPTQGQKQLASFPKYMPCAIEMLEGCVPRMSVCGLTLSSTWAENDPILPPPCEWVELFQLASVRCRRRRCRQGCRLPLVAVPWPLAVSTFARHGCCARARPNDPPRRG